MNLFDVKIIDNSVDTAINLYDQYGQGSIVVCYPNGDGYEYQLLRVDKNGNVFCKIIHNNKDTGITARLLNGAKYKLIEKGDYSK